MYDEETDGTQQTRCPKKTRWDCVRGDIQFSGLSREDAQDRNVWRRNNNNNKTIYMAP